MDKNYDAFHQDPTRFTNVDIGETDLSTIALPPPAPGTTDMASKSKKEPDNDVSKGEDTNPFILKHIDMGIAIEVDAERETVIIIDRDKTRRRNALLEDKYRQSGTFKKIRAAKNERLLKSILDKDRRTNNFRNLDDKERDKLIEIARGISVSLVLGHGIIGETEAEYKIAHARTGNSRQSHGLEPTVWAGEYLCEDISAEDFAMLLLEECQHILKPPTWIGERYINLDGKISEAVNPKEVIEHEEDFRGRMKKMALLSERKALLATGHARFANEIKLIADKIRGRTISPEEVTAFIGRLVDAGQAGSAEDIATAAIRTPPKKLILKEIGKWADLLRKISTTAADRVSGQQKQLLIRVLKDDNKIQELFFKVSARFTGILNSIEYEIYRGDCTALIEDKPTKNISSKHASFLRSYFVGLMGRKSVLTEHEEDLIRSLSLEISRTVAEQRKGKILKNTGELSFREGMRFKKIFSRYYLKDLETAKPMVFKYFTLVAWSVYGRFIRPEERGKFADIIVSIFNRKAYEDIFQDASVSSDVEITPKEAMKIFDLGRYDSANTEELLPNERRILAAVERARACMMPAFIFTPAEYFPDAVVNALSREKNSDVFTISMNGFTQRKEFFGMNLPDAANPKAEPRILAGAIARIIEYAKANPARQVYFVMENPDFVSGDIRMALHQFLLERKITIEDETDESGRKKGEIALPDNLQVVLTMERDSSVGDESFMDRASGCFLDDVSDNELKEYLCRTVGVPDVAAAFLADEIYGKSKKSRELRDRVMIQDMVQIGYYVAGMLRDNNISVSLNEVVRQEAALHLESKFSSLQDESALNELSKIAGNVADAAVEISPDGKSIVFNGIRVDIDPSSNFGAYIARKLKSDKKVPLFGEALIEFLPKDYFLTGIEERIFCLLARVYKYAPSKVVFLQGLPGGGKTTIARVFLDVVGCRQQEYTINKEADLSLFRGSLGLTPEGLKMRIADYWKELTADRSGVIINEADMRLNLMQWLWPEISGRLGRLGWEFASSDKNNPMGKAVFGKNRMLILTGNARKDMPPIISAAMPATYCMERSEDDIYKITEKMFLSGWSKMPEFARKRLTREKALDKAKILSAAYNAITKGVRDSIFTSKREVTPRQIERFKDLLFKAVQEGSDFENTFSALLYVIFIAMWDNPDDMRAANGIIRTHVADSSPPLSGEELLDFCGRFPLRIPLLILTDDTISFDEIRARLLALEPGIEEEFIPLSRFHTRKNLIGGISRGPEDKEAVNKLGILPWLILKNHLSGQKVFCWMPGYLNLNPQVVPVLNEFFQTNWLDVKEVLDDSVVQSVVAQGTEKGVYERLAREFSAATKKDLPPNPDLLDNGLKREFARFLIGYKSDNLLIRALGSTGDPIALHPADVDRFFTVNVSEIYSPQWIRRRAEAALTAIRDAEKKTFILKCIENAFRLYKEEKDEDIYPHNRLSRADIDIFLRELTERNAKNPVTREEVMLLAYHILGMGLTWREEVPDEGVHETDYRLYYAKAIGLEPGMVRYDRDFVKEGGRVYFVITAELSGKKFELARSITRYENARKIDEYGRYAFSERGSVVKARLQAPLANLLAQQASALIYISHGMGVALEGDPGGGKTSGTRDICRATGRPYYEEGMYKWISLGTLLGSLGMRGEEIVLNTLDKDKDGRFILPFLRIYAEGGTFVADEGIVSKAADYLLRWMAEAARQDEIDLGTYHPGLQGITLKRHPEFSLAITQNDHFKTKGRKPLPCELDRRFGKVRVDNILSREDAKHLIDYYLEGYPLDFKLKEDLMNLHMLLVRKHPERRMVSPRDLIDTILMIRKEAAASAQEKMRRLLFEAISVSYLEGMFDAKERSETEALIKEIFPDFRSPDYGEVVLFDRGFSNIDGKDVAHLLRSPLLIQKAKAMERMLDAGSHERRSDMPPARQVLIIEEPGASGIDFLKMFSKLTGRRLDTVEGHPFVTAKILLTGESFEFEPEFDEYGHRKIKGDRCFRQTHGALRRHLIAEDKLSSVPANERTPLLIAVTNIESIPKNELVKLNELIATREIILRDDDGKLSKFILPEWVTIVPITSDMDKLTSPFANRFRKLGLAAISDSAEAHKILSAQFPNITPEETKFLMGAVSAASIYCDNQRFELGYDFTKGDISELALRVQMYKQADSERGIVHIDPFRYSMKAITYVFLQAMCSQDRTIFIKGALEPLLSERLAGIKGDQITAYTNALIQEIRAEDRAIKRRSYEYRVSAASITGSVFRFPNGMKAHKEGDAVTVITDSQAYKFSWEGLAEKQEVKEFSKGLFVRREGDVLVLTEKLLAEIGISPLAGSPENLKRSLPLEEMGSDEFMYPADALVDALNSLLQAQTPVLTATGRLILPRVVLMAGETGSGKTTIPKMLSKAEGVPLVRINPWRRMQGSKITVSLSIGKTIEMNISDFLLACGKINGKRITAAYPTSNRVRILVDEANVTRDAWYILDAIARGEKRFSIETPGGDAVELELDTEVDIILTYNPPERYGGTGKSSNRYKFPQPFSRKAIKLYISEPLEEYSDEEMRAIMKEIYRRGEAHYERMKAIEDLGPQAAAGDQGETGFFPADEEVFVVKRVADNAILPIEQLIADINKRFTSKERALDKKKLTPEKEKEALEKEAAKFRFYPALLRDKMERYSAAMMGMPAQDRYVIFANSIFIEAMKGLALEKIDKELLGKFIAIAGNLEPELSRIIGDFSDICREKKILVKKIKSFMARFRRISFLHHVYLEDFESTVTGIGVFINYLALPVIRAVNFDSERLRDILGEDDFYAVFGDHVPDIIVADRPEDGLLGYYDGMDMVCASFGDQEKEFEIASHELGHYVSDKLGASGANEFSREIAERLRKNVELYSHLFPLMLVRDPKKYIHENLLEKMNNRRGDDDAYALASAHVLDAFSIEYAVPRIGKEFDISKITTVLKKIDSLSSGEIAQLSVKFWKAPRQYFPDVDRGVYYERQVVINGAKKTFMLSNGTAFKPRTKIVERIDVEVPGGGQESDWEGDNRGKEIDEDEEKIVVRPGETVPLPPASRVWMKKYQELFAADDNGDDLEVRYVSEGGTDVNPEAWLTRNADELLIAPEYEDEEKTLAQNVMFVIDASGSIQGAVDVQEALETMIRTYSSFLLELSRKNTDLNISLATITDYMDVLFDFNDWKKAKSHAAKRALLEESLNRIWQTGSGGGINTPMLFEKMAEIEFPSAGNKDSKNLVVVFTDGDETGSVQGDGLKKIVKEFSENKYVRTDGKVHAIAGKGKHIDIAFIGALLQDNGALLGKNYPCFLNIGEESADSYVEVLFKMAYMQAKNMSLDGDLSDTIKMIGKKSAGAQASARTGRYGTLIAKSAAGERSSAGREVRMFALEPISIITGLALAMSALSWLKGIIIAYPVIAPLITIISIGVVATIIIRNRIHFNKMIRLVGILSNKGLESDAYWSAAYALLRIAINNPNLIQPSTVQALEGILTKEGLESDAYRAAANVLSYIAINNPQLIQQVMQALEGILTKEGLENYAYQAVARTLSYITINNPNLIQPSTVQALEGILAKKGLDIGAYETAAEAISNIAINYPKLSQQAMQALEGVLTKEELESDAYVAVADALSNIAISDIAENKPELIQSSTVQALEGILTKEGL
ncbi:MAG: VWA domain-containing protein, partial [Candidatus Omnitrophota bacterium]|nr:VWA domain-containing protein [Candidatus Omnitrophota bacterium]